MKKLATKCWHISEAEFHNYLEGCILGSIESRPLLDHLVHMWVRGDREAADSVKHHPEKI